MFTVDDMTDANILGDYGERVRFNESHYSFLESDNLTNTVR